MSDDSSDSSSSPFRDDVSVSNSISEESEAQPLQNRLDAVLDQNRRILSAYEQQVDDDDLLFDESIHDQLNQTAFLSRVVFSDSPRVAVSAGAVTARPARQLDVVNNPPASKWLALNQALRARGVQHLPVVIGNSSEISDAVLDGSALLSACDELLHGNPKKFPIAKEPQRFLLTPRVQSQSGEEISGLKRQLREAQQQISVLQHQAAARTSETERMRRLVARQEKRETAPTRNFRSLREALAAAEKELAESERKFREISAQHEELQKTNARLTAQRNAAFAQDAEIGNLRDLLDAERGRFRKFEGERRELMADHDVALMAHLQTIGNLKDRVVQLETELLRRPTVAQFNELRGALVSARDAAVKERQRRSSLRSLRELMQRDREAHSLGVDRLIAVLHEDDMREILKDVCVALRVRDPELAVAQVAKLQTALQVALQGENKENSFLHTYMQLHEITDSQQVVTAMHSHARRLAELQNFWNALCSDHGLDPALTSVNRCLERLALAARPDAEASTRR